ncbi:MAG TPA: cold-shock protein [Pseudomonas sp.]|nr:cold-shock protein [Pseudomonas sp.]MBB50913.1 cold-shock protein [Pseudomonadales bacterium]MBF76790.1 cold-shock protein [Pseudomonadales bacterium]MBU30824.1 cold-shock protein [Pseudomonadales bacterium]HCA24501.1 cold-shock protein [Pseudomonas sp.]|tara:strand:- start:3428 stop:3949 length:522 start_codon:yes stop_codon:yes gene_type:complete
MKAHGKVVKWNDDRGFGFIALPQSGEEVFVHISAFPRDGVRPRIGELVSFEVGTGPDGRKRAEAIERPSTSRRKKKSQSTGKSGLLGAVLTMAAIIVIGFVGYNSYADRQSAYTTPSTSTDLESWNRAYSCDGRKHCSQMTSCAEARYFLQNCPGVQMDGNGDGEPCEQQWCN